MGAVFRIGLIIVVVLAVLAGVAFFALPNTASRSETVTLERPASAVLAHLASMPAETSVGDGVTQTVTESSPERVVAALTYGEGQTATATYTVRAQGEGSAVDVQVDQPLGANPIARLQGLGGGKAATLVSSLAAALTGQVNDIPTFDFAGLSYDVVTVQSQPFMYFGAATTQDPADIKEGVAQALLLVGPTLQRFNLQSSGRPIAVETGWDEASNTYSFQAGLPFSGTPPTEVRGLVRVGQTPGGQAVRVEYEGPEANIIPVYDQIESMVGAARLTMGRSFEVYLDDPSQPGGSARREIYVLVEGDTSLLTSLFPTTAGRAQTGVSGAPLDLAPAAPEEPAAPAADEAGVPAPAATDTAAAPAPAQ